MGREGWTDEKKAPAKAPPENTSSGVRLGVKTPLHRPSKTRVPSGSRLARGATADVPEEGE